jgi:hypothetical protein
MKSVFFFLMLYCLFSCHKEKAVASACFNIIERQCGTDAYNPYLKNATTLEEKAKSIQVYLKDQGISGTEIIPNPVNNLPVCLACSCPNGISYHLYLSVNDTLKLKSLNLLLENKSCE